MLSFDEQSALNRVMELMAIPGGSGRELQVSRYLESALLSAGVPSSAFSVDTAHERSPAGGETGNLIVRLRGTRRGPRRLLMAHMDTVPLAVGCCPVLEGDWVRAASPTTALGADDRAGCAVVLTAVLEALSQGLDYPPLTLLFAIQEETGLRGVRFLKTSQLGDPALCFNWDGRAPTDLVVGAVGASNLLITIDGIASHAGVHPEAGVSALVAASLATAELQQQGWHGRVIKGRRRGTSNLGVIRGGDATNVVMPQVVIQAEARSHEPAFRARIVAEFRRAFERAVRQLKSDDGRRGTLQFVEDQRYEAFQIDPDTPCVVAAARAAEVLELPSTLRISDGGLDANWLTAHGFPTVTLGCGQHQVHTVDERLNVPEFLTACRMALALVIRADQPASSAGRSAG